MRIIARTALIGVLFLAAFSSNAQSTDLKELYGQHRWFELREAIRNDRHASPVFLGAIAAAFNDDPEAQKKFNQGD